MKRAANKSVSDESATEKRKLKRAERRAKQRSSSEKLEVRVGCAGWFYWHRRELFYPAELPTKDWFQHYASQFRTVELNAPFYSWPTVAGVASWVWQAKQRKIIYTVKVCELVAHVKRFVGTKTLVKDCGFIADLLGNRMGCFLFQLPPSYHYTPSSEAGRDRLSDPW